MCRGEKEFKEYCAYFQERRFVEQPEGVGAVSLQDSRGCGRVVQRRDAAINIRVANKSNPRRPESRLPFKRHPQHQVAQHVLGCFLYELKSGWAPHASPRSRDLHAQWPDRIRDGLKEFKFDKPMGGVKKLSYSHTSSGAEAICWLNQ
ncbi:hypothetical protein Hypma_014408 [Hypsizygus marmoreus]|uniref:Uncharacterized protein n=1 Tax=Hypsizygus marmoreus TaxID=39966 RepID=A0A369JH14_HYPMA|nr:hypothetical protein Hypma_014408 [Hypsizygus marmoreus]